MASIGGAMYPLTVYANAMVAIEALTGLMGLARQRPDVRPVLPIHGASAVQSCGGDCSLDGVPT